MVIATRKLTVLTVNAESEEVHMSGRADTVAAPVTEGTDYLVEQRVVGVNSATLAHGHVVRRIEAGGSDIAYGSGEFLLSVDGVSGA